MKKPASEASSIQNFFDDTIVEMLAASPAVKNLHPLLRKLLEKNLTSGSQKMRQKVLKVLLGEMHEYTSVAAKLQKKYGMDPEDYIRMLKKMVSKDVREADEKKEKHNADILIQ